MTDFEKNVRIALILREKKVNWLCVEIVRETGMYCDNKRLLSVLSGKHNSPKIKDAIVKILSLEEGKRWVLR